MATSRPEYSWTFLNPALEAAKADQRPALQALPRAGTGRPGTASNRWSSVAPVVTADESESQVGHPSRCDIGRRSRLASGSNPTRPLPRRPLAACLRAGGLWGRASPSGRAGDHHRQASNNVALTGRAPDVP